MQFADVEIDRRLFKVTMTQKHLNGAQVGTRFEEMSGKAMSPMSMET